MTWMSWRQLRTGAIGTLVLLGVLLVVLAITGVNLSHIYSDYRSCSGLACTSDLAHLSRSYHNIKLIGALLILGPAILGVFWGAPLVARELESGTYRLAWSQGVSRNRWLTSKLAVSALATAVGSGALAFAFSWWSIPLDRLGLNNRIDPANFAERGIVPVAYALFALALGVAAGAMLRRTLPAMAVTLVGFTGVRMLTQYLLRPHLISPKQRSFPLSDKVGIGIERNSSGLHFNVNGSPSLHDAWVTGSKVVDANGHGPTTAFVNQACHGVLNLSLPGRPGGPGLGLHRAPADGTGMDAFRQCVSNMATRYHEVVSYQPASRFWELQWLEAAIFVGLAALLVASTVYWVRRRLV
jgi:hypothetical protein